MNAKTEQAHTPETDAETPREVLASKLIDTWVADKGRKIPWAKAIQIVAIVTQQSDAERDRLLHMGDNDGACEMCERNAITIEQQRDQLAAMLQQCVPLLDLAAYIHRQRDNFAMAQEISDVANVARALLSSLNPAQKGGGR